MNRMLTVTALFFVTGAFCGFTAGCGGGDDDATEPNELDGGGGAAEEGGAQDGEGAESGDGAESGAGLPDESGGWYVSESYPGIHLELLFQGEEVTIRDAAGGVMVEGTVSDDGKTLTFDYQGNEWICEYEADRITCPDPRGDGTIVMVKSDPPEILSVEKKTIVIDGDVSDWPEGALMVDDAVGDSSSDDRTDLDRLYVAVDDENLYLRLDLAGEVEEQAMWDGEYRYLFHIRAVQGTYNLDFFGEQDVRFSLSGAG
jgi:hypothetical protein